MKVSYSKISSFKMCPYQYYLRYVKGLKTKFNLDPANALVLGTAMHTGIEKSTLEAIKQYYSNYPSATPLMINEAIKLEVMIEKVKKVLGLNRNHQFELNITDNDFTGFIDLLVEVDRYKDIDNNTKISYEIYDFKYSNNKDSYLDSAQLHLYAYYFEKLNPGKVIDSMYFVFIPKVNLKQEEFETIEEYRERLIKECEKQKIDIVLVDYDTNKVIEFFIDTKHCIECKNFDKNPSRLCNWCEFKRYCQSNEVDDGNIIYPVDKKEEENNG